MKARTSSLSFLLVIVLPCLIQPSRGQTEPEPVVTSCLADPDLFRGGFCYPGEWPRICVEVQGASFSGPTKVDIVFLLDESTSMNRTDPDEIRHKVIQDVLSTLNASQHRAAVIAFDDVAATIGPYPSLTTDFGTLRVAIYHLPYAEGCTNIAAAVKLANDLLAGSDAHRRLAILLTDGYPQLPGSPSAYDTRQDDEICGDPEDADDGLVGDATREGITYYVVHLSPEQCDQENPGVCAAQGEEVLRYVAETTGGEYFPAETVDELTDKIPAIVAEASMPVEVKDVAMTIRFRFGEHLYSLIDESGIGYYHLVDSGALTPVDLSKVSVSGDTVRTVAWPRLPSHEGLAILIPVTSLDPFTDASTSSVLLPCLVEEDSVISYHHGDGRVHSMKIPQVDLTWIRNRIWKQLDVENGRITISIINPNPTEAMKNVRLLETPGPYFEVDYSNWSHTMETAPTYAWPDCWQDGHRHHLYWNFGDIEPMGRVNVWFSYRYCGPDTGIVETDMLTPFCWCCPEQEPVVLDEPGPFCAVYYDEPGPDGGLLLNTVPGPEWGGDITVDAGVRGLTATDSGLDLAIYSKADFDPILGDTPVPNPAAVLNSEFPDEKGCPYLETTGAPLKLDERCRLCVTVANCGDVDVPKDGFYIEAFVRGDYAAGVEDMASSQGWYPIGLAFSESAIEIPDSGLPVGSHDTLGCIWRPEDTHTDAFDPTSPTVAQALSECQYAYFKVVVHALVSDPLECRLNNNVAFKRVEIVHPD